MIEAFLWGIAVSSALLIGAGVTYLFRIKTRTLGLIMAFGVGLLISALAYELVTEAFHIGNNLMLFVGLVAGALVFFIGDSLIDRAGGKHRKRSSGKHEPESGPAILLGTVLDSIPESLIIGLTFMRGGVINIAMVVAIFLSNLPESIAATTGLRASGWKRSHIFLMWLTVVLVAGVAALVGYTLFGLAPDNMHAFVMAFAAGAILTMLADTMMPEAYQDSGKLVGLITTLGFCLGFALSTIS